MELFYFSVFSKSNDETRFIIGWSLFIATLVSLVLYYYHYYYSRALFKRRRKKTLGKSIQQRPKRRPKRFDSDFRGGFRQKKAEEVSAQLQEQEEEEYEEFEDYDLDEASLKEMHDALPDSTKAECRRFLIDADGDTQQAIKALESYLDWRQTHADIEKKLTFETEPQDDNIDKDLALWNTTVAIARVANGNVEESSSNTTKATRLPRIIRTFQSSSTKHNDELTDDHGNVIIKLTPAQIDNKLVSDVKTYSLAIALYLDRKLDRHDAYQTITLLIDVRGGKGWPNPSPKTLLPFLKHTVQLLLEMLPERLYKAIVFPIPGGFNWMWTVVKRGVNPETADRIHLVSGAARISSEPPIEELSEYAMSRDLLEFIEQERLATFCYE